MASKPKAKLIAEVLASRADEIIGRVGAGDDLADLARNYGIWPYHVRKFFSGMPEYVERFRDAVEAGEKLRAKSKRGRGGDQREASPTHAEIIKRHEDDILEMIRGGMLVLEVAQLLEVQRAAITRHFSSTEDLKARYQEALNDEGADAMAERAVMATVRPAFNLVEAKMAELQATRLSWLAGQRNPRYSPKQDLNLNGALTHNVTIDIAP